MAVTAAARSGHQKKPRPKANLYAIIARAVEEGVAYGYRRAHKYVDDPEVDTLHEQIEQAVLDALCEVLDLAGE